MKIDLTYFLSDGSTEIGVIEDNDPPGSMLLGRFGFVKQDVTTGFVLGVDLKLEKIKYIKTVDLEDGTPGKCAAVEFNVNSVEACTL